ncbi:transcriptional regulator [Stutzerimonas tarimensis]|uniref:Transcriptional regulator n=1 Tax=Stutzerimonas tarimensis TaxID=1507735 RepID=A0ABV7TAD3_9GAMM
MSYNWDLMARLLREIRDNGEETFKPRQIAEAHAMAMEGSGQSLPDMDDFRMEAANYEGDLFNGGFIVARPDDLGGNGENFALTERGTRLLQLLENGGSQARQRLDSLDSAALTGESFDPLAADFR